MLLSAFDRVTRLLFASINVSFTELIPIPEPWCIQLASVMQALQSSPLHFTASHKASVPKVSDGLEGCRQLRSVCVSQVATYSSQPLYAARRANETRVVLGWGVVTVTHIWGKSTVSSREKGLLTEKLIRIHSPCKRTPPCRHPFNKHSG